MGILSKIKRRLPIVGGPRAAQPAADPAPAAARPAARPTPPAPRFEESRSPRGGRAPQAFIDELVKGNKIVLFMKGSPDAPQCGFSANAAAVLRSYGKPFAHFDVFLDDEVREAVKAYSQWPTLPQIYVNGEFLGGSDILTQMHQSGELKAEIEKAFTES